MTCFSNQFRSESVFSSSLVQLLVVYFAPSGVGEDLFKKAKQINPCVNSLPLENRLQPVLHPFWRRFFLCSRPLPPLRCSDLHQAQTKQTETVMAEEASDSADTWHWHPSSRRLSAQSTAHAPLSLGGIFHSRSDWQRHAAALGAVSRRRKHPPPPSVGSSAPSFWPRLTQRALKVISGTRLQQWEIWQKGIMLYLNVSKCKLKTSLKLTWCRYTCLTRSPFYKVIIQTRIHSDFIPFWSFHPKKTLIDSTELWPNLH